MLLSLVYFVLRRLLRALAPSDRIDVERENELLVLRHQLKVLSRGVRRRIRECHGPVTIPFWDGERYAARLVAGR